MLMMHSIGRKLRDKLKEGNTLTAKQKVKEKRW
jgi:hypothetical protein